MRLRNKSTGYRQHAWDALRVHDWPTTKELADHVGCVDSGLRNYIGLLEKHGYVERHADGSITLVRNTGPRAPSASVHTGELRDWNLQPQMTGAEVERAIAGSGLSRRAWLIAAGFHGADTTRLRQMINGQRPVTDEIAAAVRAQLARS